MLLQDLITTIELIDLGKVDPAWAGILSPVYEEKTIRKYVHEQFLEHADRYIDKYRSNEYAKWFLSLAQKHFSFDQTDHPLAILDLGSGAGNTFFPLLELYPTAYVIASDLSLPLLKALKQHQVQYYPDYSCSVIQLNAEDIIFECNQFDLVVGQAILHHLFSPEITIRESYRVLKSQGVALFFEPFEIGNQIIALTVKHLLTLNEYYQEKIPGKIINFFKNLCWDFQLRKNTDKKNPIFQQIDDKWLFTKSYIERISKDAGFSDTIIYPLHPSLTFITDQIKTYLLLGLELEDTTLPQWARDHLHEIEEQFSPELRDELMTEGSIVLKK
jgi:ubiquinone/menaquinone biosynthesis C-methylase UbiE